MKISKLYSGGKRVLSALCAAALLLNTVPAVLAENISNTDNTSANTSSAVKNDNAEKNYRQVIKSYSFDYFDGEEISLNAADAVLGEAD
ncbi:MAG: hypothetical protein U0K93_06725, partial [Acutalibacteraceae bacterium]|nr:hypothetical protein [Acutalibacteraceae bacterium]